MYHLPEELRTNPTPSKAPVATPSANASPPGDTYAKAQLQQDKAL
jgi:hypothetical protein